MRWYGLRGARVIFCSPCNNSFRKELRTFAPPDPNIIPRYLYSPEALKEGIMPSLVARNGVGSTTHRLAFPSTAMLREEDFPSAPALIVKPPLERCDSNFPNCDRRPARDHLAKRHRQHMPGC